MTKTILTRIVALLLLMACLFMVACEDTPANGGQNDGGQDNSQGTGGANNSGTGDSGNTTPGGADDSDGGENEAVVKNPTYIFSDITLTEGETIPLIDALVVDTSESPITYSATASEISISGASLTALSVTSSAVKVNATCEKFEASFYVNVNAKTPEPTPTYGQMLITAPSGIYTNYPAKPITVTFSDPTWAENVAFTSDTEGVYVMENRVGAVGIFNDTVTATITAATLHHSTSFSVKVSTFTSKKSEQKVSYYEQTYIKNENKGGMVFVGDSYFDGHTVLTSGSNITGETFTPPFWSDFYTDFASEKAFLFGISSATIQELEVVSDRLVYPMAPSEIVVHIGFNDIHSGSRAVEDIAADIQALLTEYHRRLPDARVYYVGIEPKKANADGITWASEQWKNSCTVKLPALVSSMKSFVSSNSSWCSYIDTSSLTYIGEGDNKKVNNSFFLSTDASHPTLSAYDDIRGLLNAERERLGLYNPSALPKPVVNDFTPVSSGNVTADSTEIKYNGASLTADYVLEGTINVTDIGTNAHLAFYLSNNNRIYLWDSDSDGVYGIGYRDSANTNENASGNDKFKFSDGNNVHTFALVVTNNDAYFFLNGKKVVTFSNMATNIECLKIGNSGNMSSSLSEMTLTVKSYNADDYNNKLSEYGITY